MFSSHKISFGWLVQRVADLAPTTPDLTLIQMQNEIVQIVDIYIYIYINKSTMSAKFSATFFGKFIKAHRASGRPKGPTCKSRRLQPSAGARKGP